MTNENYKGLSFRYDSNNPQKPKTQVLDYREETDEYLVLHYSKKEIIYGPVVRNLIDAEREQRATNKSNLRNTNEWETLFAELQRLQNSGKHEDQDIITITGFMSTIEELAAHVKANR